MSGHSAGGNGHGNGAPRVEASRGTRVDPPRGAGAGETDTLGPRHTGRLFVLAMGFVLTAFAVALFVAFRQWRERQEELADYGRLHVASAVEPLAEKVPSGIEAGEWGRVVEQTRAVLEGLTASGVMDLGQMQSLRRDLIVRVDGARAATAATVLEGIWASLEQRAGPIVTQSPRFELAATLNPLARRRPEGVTTEDWDLAMARTRAMLIAVTADRETAPPTRDRRALRDGIADRLLKTTPESALKDLGWVWDVVQEEKLMPEGFTRPKVGDGG
jgi:hypothetical protein